MNKPVDLTNLRSMTDGDRDLEKALFEEFYSSFEAGIRTLQSNCVDTACETWRKQAHALKGISVNLGAEVLGTLCKNAQEEHLADAPAKHALIKQIQEEYSQVKSFLDAIV